MAKTDHQTEAGTDSAQLSKTDHQTEADPGSAQVAKTDHQTESERDSACGARTNHQDIMKEKKVAKANQQVLENEFVERKLEKTDGQKLEKNFP